MTKVTLAYRLDYSILSTKRNTVLLLILYSSQNVMDFQSLILKLKMLLILREKDTLIIKSNLFYKIRPYD